MGNAAKATGKYDKKSARFGFQHWNLEASQAYEELIQAVLKEGMDIATKEYECIAWFEIVDRELPDASTIKVELPLGESEDSGPAWSFSLKEIIGKEIEAREMGVGGPIHTDDKRSLSRLRASLLALVRQLDEALARE